MYDDTPNMEEIDWIEDRVRELYDYERLKDCDIDFLYNLEYAVDNRVMIFKSTFPDKGGMGGEMRAFIYDDENEADKEALTNAERLRLQFLKEEARIEIHRAFGHRKELRRKHRSRLANALSDAIGKVADALTFWT